MTEGGFATLRFERQVGAPVATLWQVWTAPAARAVWAAPAPAVTVEFLEADTRIGGREVSLCRVAGQPDIRVECGWLVLQPLRRSVNCEVLSSADELRSAALVTADFAGTEVSSRLVVTVQLSSLAQDMAQGYQQGFDAGLANLAGVAERTMVIERRINAPVATVFGAWANPETLPGWWGPRGYSCRTIRIDLRQGGEWVFDMIAPDGTVFPNHHRYGRIVPGRRIEYALLWGENGPRHADAWAAFEAVDGGTLVTLGMVLASAEEFARVRDFGAAELGLQTLGKLAAMVGAP